MASVIAPQACITTRSAKISALQTAAPQRRRFRCCEWAGSFEWKSAIGVTLESKNREVNSVGLTTSGKRSVGKRVIGVPRCQNVNVVAEVAPADLQEFICSGVLAKKVGATPEKVLERLDEWDKLGTQLSTYLRFDEDGLSEAEKVRIYQYYLPVYFWCRDQLTAHRSRFAPGELIPPFVVGISAPQGCGKTTIVESLDYLFNVTGCPTAAMSIDDVYLTAADQDKLAAENPENALVEFRGNAGSHDLQLGTEILESLLKLTSAGTKAVVPRYNKAARNGRGDRADPSKWSEVKGPLQMVLFEGWMLGFEPQSEDAVTAVDPQLGLVNKVLKEYHEAWYRYINSWIIVQVGDVNWVYDWRLEAEVQMRKKGKGGLTDEEVADFVSRYIPAYKAYLPSLYSQGPRNSSADKTLRISINQDRNPIG